MNIGNNQAASGAAAAGPSTAAYHHMGHIHMASHHPNAHYGPPNNTSGQVVAQSSPNTTNNNNNPPTPNHHRPSPSATPSTSYIPQSPQNGPDGAASFTPTGQNIGYPAASMTQASGYQQPQPYFQYNTSNTAPQQTSSTANSYQRPASSHTPNNSASSPLSPHHYHQSHYQTSAYPHYGQSVVYTTSTQAPTQQSYHMPAQPVYHKYPTQQGYYGIPQQTQPPNQSQQFIPPSAGHHMHPSGQMMSQQPHPQAKIMNVMPNGNPAMIQQPYQSHNMTAPVHGPTTVINTAPNAGNNDTTANVYMNSQPAHSFHHPHQVHPQQYPSHLQQQQQPTVGPQFVTANKYMGMPAAQPQQIPQQPSPAPSQQVPKPMYHSNMPQAGHHHHIQQHQMIPPQIPQNSGNYPPQMPIQQMPQAQMRPVNNAAALAIQQQQTAAEAAAAASAAAEARRQKEEAEMTAKRAAMQQVLNQLGYLLNLPLTRQEEEILADYDCRLYGFLKLESSEHIFKKFFIIKAINCYEKRVRNLTKENVSLTQALSDLTSTQSQPRRSDDRLSDNLAVNKMEVDDVQSTNSNSIVAASNTTTSTTTSNRLRELKKRMNLNRIKLAKHQLALGHFYLLIYDYVKSLHAYQTFLTLKINKLKDSTFYYGLGIVYFVFGALKSAEKALLCALYKDSSFQRVNEIHFRLGVIYRELNDFTSSLKHFKLAYIDSSSSLSSLTKSEIKFCIAHLFEQNNKSQEAVERYEEILKTMVNEHSHSHPTHNPVTSSSTTTQSSSGSTSSGQVNSSQSSHNSSSAKAATTSKPEDTPANLFDLQLKSRIYRQLGWLYYSSSDLVSTNGDERTNWQATPLRSEHRAIPFLPVERQIIASGSNNSFPIGSKIEVNQRLLNKSIDHLTKSAQLDSTNNLAWYSIGRALATKSQSKEAFISLKNSVLNPDSDADTWCSMGILYYQQRQFMDSLHAFVCALRHQEDSPDRNASYYASWLNIGILYEQDNQLEEALKSYKSALRAQCDYLGITKRLEELTDVELNEFFSENSNTVPNNENMNKKASLQLYKEELRLLHQRVRVLENFFAMLDEKQRDRLRIQAKMNGQCSLPGLKDAFGFNVPTELGHKIIINKQLSQVSTLSLASNLEHVLKTGESVDDEKFKNGNVLCSANNTPQGPPMKKIKLNETITPATTSSTASSSTLTNSADNNKENSSDKEIHLHDLNSLIQKVDELTDGNMKSLDSVLKSSTSTQDKKDLSRVTFQPDQIKLDASLTNGLISSSSTDLTQSQLQQHSDLPPPSDHELLTSSLNTNMSAEHILNACRSYGLNGIQNMCLLKPGRLRNKLLSLSRKQLMKEKLTLEENENSDFSDRDDSDSDENDEELDDTLPYGGDHCSNNETVNLSPPGPSVVLESKRDAYSPHLLMFCMSQPLTVVRGLGNALKLDLSLFSTKTLVETDPNHVVETRTQLQQSTDENWELNGRGKASGNSWRCDSTQSFTTLLKYAKYQAHNFQETVREEKMKASADANKRHVHSSPNSKKIGMANSASHPGSAPVKTIKFGTNVDLSDETKWRAQAQELAKLPPFMRVISPGNMLSHIGYRVDGVNSLQMYLKVPGCRTPGHQENNSFCSLNINIGPGDCEWFGCDEKYWRRIEALCHQHGVDYLSGSWWPNLAELHKAGIPVYRFLQKPGDLVWVNVGCVHWVQAIGWCNNVSWNVGPMCYMQYKSALERYEWNRLRFYKSIVPMVHLSWQLARNIKITDRRLFDYVKYVLMHSLKQCQLAMNYIENCGVGLKHQARLSDEPAHYCYDCEAEVFNILFISEQPVSDHHHSSKNKDPNSATATHHVVHCQACARKRNHLLDNFVILNQYELSELKQIYDNFQLYVPGNSIQSIINDLSSKKSATSVITAASIATINTNTIHTINTLNGNGLLMLQSQ